MGSAVRIATLGAIRAVSIVVTVVAAAYGTSQVALAFLSRTVTVPSAQHGLLDLPLGIRLVVTLAVFIACLTVAVVALAIGRLARRVQQDVSFAPETTFTVTIAGTALILGPGLAQFLAHVGAQLVVENGSDETFEFSWFFIPDLSLSAVGVALLVIALVLRHGELLQRDAEGLV
jgi:hypothetical protein